MFTGLVEARGRVESVRKVGGEIDLGVDVSALAPLPALGASVALSGVCCTVVALASGVATFRLSEETLKRTWLGGLRPGDILNLEDALRAGEPLGGHMVQGHVDGVGEIERPIDPEAGGDLWVRLPPGLRRYCVEKGSLAVDGVSLTIAELDGDRVRIAIIPHTAAVTTLGRRPAGAPVNIEVDVLAKYVERMLEGWRR